MNGVEVIWQGDHPAPKVKRGYLVLMGWRARAVWLLATLLLPVERLDP